MPTATDPAALLDDGSDLWGRTPQRQVQCPGCGLRAEPFELSFCWLCCVTGQAARVVDDLPTSIKSPRKKKAGGCS